MGWHLTPPIRVQKDSHKTSILTHLGFTSPTFQTAPSRKADYFQTMAKDMTLYWGSGSPPCWRVMVALEEKNLQGYNSKLLSFEKGEHKSAEVMKINPRGQLPAFKHGDFIINESIGICEYLECAFKSQGNMLVPECPKEKGQMWQRMYEGNTLMMKMADVAFYTWRVPEGERHDSALKRNKEALSTEVKLWEDYLKQGNGQFLAGNKFTLADVVVFPIIAFLFRMGLCEDKYPKLSKYYNHLKIRPSIQNSWPPTWKETPGQEVLKEI